jgi:ABC-type multidrug transport system fused ATPase/permease subunit
MEFWKKYWQLIKPYKREIIITFVWIGIVQIFLLIGPYIFKLILDEFQNWNQESVRMIWILTAAMLVLQFTITGLNNIKYKNIFGTSLILERELPKRCMKKLLELSYGYHVRENTGAKMGKITRGTWKAIEIIIMCFFDVSPVLFQMILILGVFLVMDWQIAPIFLVVISVYLFSVFHLDKTIRPMRQLRFDRYEKADHMMTQAVLNVQSVQVFTQEPREYNTFQKLKKLIHGNELKEWYTMINFDWYQAGVVNLGRVVILGVAVYQLTQNSITVGTLVFLLLLSNKLFDSLHVFSHLYERIVDAGESVNRLSDILNEPSEITSLPSAKKLRKVEGRITFDKVHFCYPNTSNGLHGVDLDIVAGETIGVCGPSGGGKSTLARLIPRFYDTCSGQVQIDRQNVSDLDLESFRKHIAIVPQEVEVFDATVAQNIAYGNPKATMGEIRRAAAIANVDEFVDQLEDGYKTFVGERGLKLSGGQRQRVGIARAILADPAVLIFDEATSHLDPLSEKLIHESITKLQGSRTMILIAHRLSTIQNADRIAVLGKGKVMEQGTHSELLRKKGLYHELATSQNGH